MSFKRILVATDFSPCSAKALEIAGSLAKVFDAKVILCHALEAPEEHTLLGGSLKPLVNFPEEQRKAETALRAEAKKASLEDRLESVEVLMHQPGEEVTRLAGERDCDLIVVGTHGRTGFRHFVMGSVTERICRMSPVPVLVVPSKDKPA